MDEEQREPEIRNESVAFYELDPRNIQLERIVGMIVTMVLTAGGLVGFGIWYFSAGFSLIWLVSLGGLGVLFLVLAVLSWVWPGIEHRHAGWRLDETGLEIRRGVFWRHQLSVPLARLQHADIAQGPLQRQYGLSKLTVYTAGTANSSVELNGLAAETAAWLRDRLLQQREELDVV